MDTDALSVVFVCTGNRFRSPLAAALLAAERPDLSLRISSYGTLELGSASALPEAVELGDAFGLDLSTHCARSIVGTDLEPFDLVLGFERQHVAVAVVDAGARAERTFTLPEFVGLLETVPDRSATGGPLARARLRIQAAHAARTPEFRRRPLPELADPLGLPRSVQQDIAGDIRASVSILASRLFD